MIGVRYSMSDLGKLRREMDIQTTKIKLAMLKLEVRIEMRGLPKKEVKAMVSTVRKIYINVNEKLLEATTGNECDEDVSSIRKVWIQVWSEAKAVVERLVEIVEDIERTPNEDIEDRLKFYKDALFEVLHNPPMIYFGSYPEETTSEETPSVTEYEASVDSEDDEKQKISIRDLTFASQGYGSNKKLRPVRVDSGDYSLESDQFYKSSEPECHSSTESSSF